MGWCQTCGRTDTVIGYITTPDTGQDRFCSEACLEADPRAQAATAAAQRAAGLFTCHNAAGVPYNGTHHLPHCAYFTHV